MGDFFMNHSYLLLLHFFASTFTTDNSPQTKKPVSVTPTYPEPNLKLQETVRTNIAHFEKLLENSEHKKKLQKPGDISNS